MVQGTNPCLPFQAALDPSHIESCHLTFGEIWIPYLSVGCVGLFIYMMILAIGNFVILFNKINNYKYS